ncbi:glycine zipper family protein [Nitrosospira lacus]|uniref:Glycine zipper family protein n=1 Tax=Nitrosospira lacus TaxID=1288494 RepID=A0A1W6SLI2_9PROT|nr:glycine zipper family protein [Nitrosospira lacus]
MMPKIIKLCALLAISLLAGCASIPTGPSIMALPGSGRSFDEFRYDDYYCRQFAYEQVGGMTPNRASITSGVGSAAVGAGLGAAAGAALGGGRGAAIGAGTGLLAGGLAGTNTAGASGNISQQRYDTGYTQCMYARGHRVPVSGQINDSSLNGYNRYMGAPNPTYPPATGIQGGTLPPPPPPPPGIPPPPPPSGKILKRY